MSFKKINNIEYEIQIGGRTRTVKVPFGKTELLFKEFISSGGVIDPQTGAVQNDLISLISSFRSVGNILLTEFDEAGKVTEEGNCFHLESEDLLALFQLATSVIENFISGLTAMKTEQETQSQQNASEKAARKTKKD